MRCLPAWLLLFATALAGADALRVEVPGVARSGGILRVLVTRPCAPDLADGGPVRLVAELRDGDRPVAAAELLLPHLGQLAGGATLVLVPDAAGERPLRLVATLTRPTRPGAPPAVETAGVTVATPGSVLAEANAAAGRLRRAGDLDPLPWLWAEQAADCAADGATAARVGEVATIAARLRDWLGGWRPDPPAAGASAWALRDPVDGSAQPFRLHLPQGAGPFPVALLAMPPAPGLSKAHWPMPPGRWLAAAAEAGLAVVECYPAGDRGWNGAAARRAPLALAAAQRLARLDLQHGVVVGRERPDGPWHGVEPDDRAGDPGWWRSLPGPPRQPEAALRRDLATVFSAPFTVVVGSGEHAAARAWNRRLADALRAAYAAHAHAFPPEVADDGDPATCAGRNLVLIGNPRSNRVLASLGLRLPFAWDHRTVRGDGFIALRADLPSIACLADLPDGRLALVLDGGAPAWGDGLPLAGLPSPWSAHAQ